MFRFFSNWYRYLANEIREGNHLDKAVVQDYKYFFEKNTFSKSNHWAILRVVGDDIYWGKINQDRVEKSAFFKTSKKSIEENFAALSAEKKKSLLDILNEYVRKYLGKIDGVKYSIKDSNCNKIEILENSNYHALINVDLDVTPTTLNPQTRQETKQFSLTLNPSDWALVEIKKV